MGQRRRILTDDELTIPFRHGPWADRFPPVLTVTDVADLLRVGPKTIYEWVAKGRFEGTFRRRGKRLLFWRVKVVALIFNGPSWSEFHE
jgi:excisionase family DNA binding protein